MLINAQRPEELRVAIVDGTALVGYQVDVAAAGLTRGNIYRGVIANVQPSLNAAFIDYGGDRHGFLPIQDVVPQAYYREPAGSHPRIEEVLERAKPIVVQVAKDAVGEKGASLTTNLSLAGRYLVLTPFDETRGVSRKVEDEDVRKKLRQLVAKLDLPEGCGIIVRTNALDQTKLVLQRDLAALLRLWKRVQTEARRGKGTRLLYSDQDLLVQALRDHLDASIEEVLVDNDDAFERAAAYMAASMPRSRIRLVRYADRLPLFSRFDVEPQLALIHERRVPLPSGGSIVIDPTEALTAIDVNSGRSTKAASQEETALHTNLEAAQEVARQLRLRDIGGLVVVDFIDMRASKNQRKVEKGLRDAMKEDKARTSIGRISSNGLLEINRQRIRQPLALRTHRSCPTCGGSGTIASPEAVSLSLLRRIEARAATGKVEAVRIALHPELADAFQNGMRQELAALEKEFELRIEVAASPGLHRAEEKIDWTHRDKPKLPPPPRVEPRVLSPADLAPGDEEEEEEVEVEVEEPAPAPARAKAKAKSEGASRGRGRERARGGERGAARGGEKTGGERGGGKIAARGGERSAARPAARPEAAAQAAELGEAGRKRKRRRGGRKRKKGHEVEEHRPPGDLLPTERRPGDPITSWAAAAARRAALERAGEAAGGERAAEPFPDENEDELWEPPGGYGEEAGQGAPSGEVRPGEEGTGRPSGEEDREGSPGEASLGGWRGVAHRFLRHAEEPLEGEPGEGPSGQEQEPWGEAPPGDLRSTAERRDDIAGGGAPGEEPWDDDDLGPGDASSGDARPAAAEAEPGGRPARSRRRSRKRGGQGKASSPAPAGSSSSAGVPFALSPSPGELPFALAPAAPSPEGSPTGSEGGEVSPGEPHEAHEPHEAAGEPGPGNGEGGKRKRRRGRRRRKRVGGEPGGNGEGVGDGDSEADAGPGLFDSEPDPFEE